jgi:hypothetical protein
VLDFVNATFSIRRILSFALAAFAGSIQKWRGWSWQGCRNRKSSTPTGRNRRLAGIASHDRERPTAQRDIIASQAARMASPLSKRDASFLHCSRTWISARNAICLTQQPGREPQRIAYRDRLSRYDLRLHGFWLSYYLMPSAGRCAPVGSLISNSDKQRHTARQLRQRS